MTIDEEWEALAVVLKLQGYDRVDVKNLFHADSGPCWDLYVKEGISRESTQDHESRVKFFTLQNQRDRALMYLMFGESHDY